jgi:hypothetical protein
MGTAVISKKGTNTIACIMINEQAIVFINRDDLYLIDLGT